MVTKDAETGPYSVCSREAAIVLVTAVGLSFIHGTEGRQCLPCYRPEALSQLVQTQLFRSEQEALATSESHILHKYECFLKRQLFYLLIFFFLTG